jgi:hypothetical protein
LNQATSIRSSRIGGVVSHRASKYKIPLDHDDDDNNNNNNNVIFLFVQSANYATTVNTEEQKDKSKLGL